MDEKSRSYDEPLVCLEIEVTRLDWRRARLFLRCDRAMDLESHGVPLLRQEGLLRLESLMKARARLAEFEEDSGSICDPAKTRK
jgi:hypothetical protein